MKPSALKALSGETFEHPSEIEKTQFLKKEVLFWKKFLQENHTALNNSDPDSLRRIQSSVSILESQTTEDGFISFGAYEDDDELCDIWIYSQSPSTIKWIQMHSETPTIAKGFYDAIFFNKTKNLDSFDALTGYLTAYEFRRPTHDTFSERSAVEKLTLTEIHSDFFKTKYRLIKHARTKLAFFSDWQEKEQIAWKARTDTLESTYKEKLRLEGPAKYWAQKAAEHEMRGYVWTGILAVVLTIATVSLWTSFNIWLTGDHTKINLSHVEGALIFVALLSTLAFSVKSLSKLAFSAFHLQRDAEEREQLTHLYLTLSKDTQVDDESRKIILQSLFSRSETGLISNESGPTMPGLTDLLSAIKK